MGLLDAIVSIWRKTGHFYFALTRGQAPHWDRRLSTARENPDTRF